MAGVGGGLAVILVSIKFSSAKVEIVKIIRSPSIFPFGLLITFVVLQKLGIGKLFQKLNYREKTGLKPNIQSFNKFIKLNKIT